MSFGEAVSSCLSKYVTFSGRARRSEFWWFYLFCALVVITGLIIDAVVGTAPLFYALTALALFLPQLAASIRRLHDVDKSGWFFLVGLIPLVGGIILLVFWVKEGTAGPNQYGADPKGRAEQYGYAAPEQQPS